MAGQLPSPDQLYEHAACGLVLTSRDGTIGRINTTACRWLGYSADELVGRERIQGLFTVGARVFHQTHCQPLLELQGSVAELQVELRHRDGHRIPMLINVVRQRHDDVVFDEWALFVATDRQSYERELRLARESAEAALEAKVGAEAKLQALNEQLSQADRRKDEFLATLSHELRNPMAPMRSALELLMLKLRGNGEVDRTLAVFDRQLNHLTHLVDDLMEVSRITQGRMQLRLAPLDLGTVMAAAAEDVRPAMAAARHRFAVTLPQPGLTVNADATRLAQVIVNLLTNAAKYTPDGGEISLAATAAADGHAEIRVKDNGIGIPSHALQTVFEMFSQLKPALDRSKGGLGIGLALVRGIVSLHGGTISADSAGAGMGSEFTVRLPLATAPAQQPGPALESAPVNPLRILVVDDNVDAADTLVMALGMYGHQAEAAYSARAGEDAVARFAPQVAVLDIGLPDLNGYELARRLRSTPAGHALYLIAATGWGQEADRRRALEAGYDAHLTKPVDFEQLLRLLGAAGASHRKPPG